MSLIDKPHLALLFPLRRISWKTFWSFLNLQILESASNLRNLKIRRIKRNLTINDNVRADNEYLSFLFAVVYVFGLVQIGALIFLPNPSLLNYCHYFEIHQDSLDPILLRILYILPHFPKDQDLIYVGFLSSFLVVADVYWRSFEWWLVSNQVLGFVDLLQPWNCKSWKHK